MGVGLSVWLSEEVDVSAVLAAQGWLPDDEGGAEHPSSNYLASAGSPSRVFSPDVPEEVTALVPGIAWMVGLALEGVTPTGQRVLSKAATAIARAGHGVVEDPQEGVFRTPSGVRRYDKPKAAENVTVVSMGWWAPGGPLLTREGIAVLYETIERLLPEAVPRRWGLGEPPDHSLAEEGTSALVAFVDEFRDDFLVFKLSAPCLDEQVHVHSQWGMRGGRFNRFETTYLRIDIESSVLAQPGWGRQLAQAFETVTGVVRPFYAEARLLEMKVTWSGYDMRSQLHPVDYFFWRGIPVGAPLAAALGPPYTDAWPDFPGQRFDDLLIASDEQWQSDQTVHPWEPPTGVAQEFDGHWAPSHGGYVSSYPRSWPDTWPFVLADGTMPTMDGWEDGALARMRAAHSKQTPPAQAGQ